MIKYFYLFVFALPLLSCRESNRSEIEFQLTESKKLCYDCQSPNICKVGTNKLLVSYIKSGKNGIDHLIFRTYEDGKISDKKTIASGDNWFVNWADIPSITTLGKNGEILMAHWLQMSAEGTYDYDIRYSISQDGGTTWRASKVLHDDEIAAEHGFVTLASDSKGAFATWLDGRNTKTPSVIEKEEKDEGHGHDDHGHGGTMPMTLRAAWIDESGNKSNELEIDDRVCDCCQTDAVITNSSPVVVYRDRSDDEIRDISIARYADKKWTHKTLHKDNWHIAGCPVNGPAAAYNNGKLAVVWYTQLNDLPKIYLSISKDDGINFETPMLIAEDEVLGRVDVAMTGDEVIVTWMENSNEKTYISGRKYDIQASKLRDTKRLLSASEERGSGFPIIETVNEQLIIARTTISSNEEKSVFLEVFEGV